MTPTPTSGAADRPEALRRSTAADGKTELFNLPGYPLMVRAVDFNRIHAESEMRRAALLDEMQKAALAAGQATAAPENIRGILARCRDFIDTTKAPAYPAGADLADEIDVLLAAQPAPQPAPAPLSEREEFERDWEKRHAPVPINDRTHDDGRYGDSSIQDAWESWQARAAIAAQGDTP